MSENIKTFDKTLSRHERKVIACLDTPNKIQMFLDELSYSSEDIYRSPLNVLRDGACQCFDGALFAATIMYRKGQQPPLILNLLPNDRDDDHILALYRKDGHWGAIAKSNFVGLRFREPVHRNLRELVMSYFELYYNVAREKTLRGYTLPLNLKTFDKHYWMTNAGSLESIAERLDSMRRVFILTKKMASGLSLTDERSCQAGLLGANNEGLYVPPGRNKSQR